MTDATPEIDLRPDGTATLVLASGTVTLRRPTIGELRALEESLTDANDAVRDASLRLRLLPAQPTRRDDESDDEYGGRIALYQEERDEVRRLVREFSAESQRRYVGWFRQVVDMLGTLHGAILPTDDDALPSWASAVALGSALLTHWTTVPLPVATR